MAISLTKDQQANVRKHLERFQKRLRHELSDQGWQKERRERTVLYRQLMSEKNIDKLSEKDIGKILRTLWSASFWKNKDYFVNKVIGRADAGLDHAPFYGVEDLFGRHQRAGHIGCDDQPAVCSLLDFFDDPQNTGFIGWAC